MRSGWRVGVWLVLGLMFVAPPVVAAPCSGEPAACAAVGKTALGLPYQAALTILQDMGEKDRQVRIERLSKALEANPVDDLARLELIMLGGDDRKQTAIATSLADLLAKAGKAGDPTVAALARLLSIPTIDAEGEEAEARITALVEAALADIQTMRHATMRGGQARLTVDDADLLAGLIARRAVFDLDEAIEDYDRDVGKAHAALLQAAIEAFSARLERAPRDPARFQLLVEALRDNYYDKGRYDRLVEICRRWTSVAPANPKARRSLVSALAARADERNLADKTASALADAEALAVLAKPTAGSARLDAIESEALVASHRVRAVAQGKTEPVRAAATLAEGLEQLRAGTQGDPAQSSGDDLILAAAMLAGERIDKQDAASADAIETKLLSVLAEPERRAQLRDMIAARYQTKGEVEAAMQRYRRSMAELAAAPLDGERSWRFFAAARNLLDLGRRDARSFDADAHARLLTDYAAEARLRALDGLDGKERARLLLQIADALHVTAKRLEEAGIEAPRIGLLEREIALREPLVRDPAERANRLDDLARAYRDLSDAFDTANREKEALDLARKRVEIRRELKEKSPSGFDELSDYVWALRDFGDEQRHVGDDKGAQASYQEGAEVGAMLLERFPDRGGSYEAMSAIQVAMGHAARSTMMKLIHYKRAEATNLAHLGKLGEKKFDQDFLAVSSINIGDTYLEAGKYQAALTHLGKALEASDKSLADDKDNNSLLRRRVRIFDKMARAEQGLGRTEPAIATRRRQIELLEKLARLRGAAVENQAEAYEALISLLSESGDHADEIAEIRRKVAAL
ncbi:hypothetical protein FZC33_18070 [Labrys sp. KNU-23]|uniref:hypothetical protein n=1 Tax=Labrys sp. KNU-23 TaxID=2789216 RepID=UPI0011F04FE9|nr:hypothetical protein [Labrys sp. KNU-23]QEN88086.1 hypothetical protein FZC33_18070 [Labrys sp. KNU-23]